MGVAVGVSLLQPSVYEVSAKVVVTPTENTNPQKNFSNVISGLQMLAYELGSGGADTLDGRGGRAYLRRA